jgi:hypothetical protein
VRILWRGKKENMNSKAILYEDEKEEMVYTLNFKLFFLILSAKIENLDPHHHVQ